MKSKTERLAKKNTDKMNDSEVLLHLARMCASEMDVDITEATKRVSNLISSGLLFRFKQNSEEAAIFTDHFLMIPSDIYAKHNDPIEQASKVVKDLNRGLYEA